MQSNSHKGFTLVELLITIVVVGILASIAVPSYRNYVMRAQRTEAKAALLRIQAAQEKYYLQNNKYTKDLSDTGLKLGDKSENGYYTLNVDFDGVLGDQSFIAFAIPGDNSPQKKDKDCLAFIINDRGARWGEPGGLDKCWR
jgi:type IV pilus assembly protein PilE